MCATVLLHFSCSKIIPKRKKTQKIINYSCYLHHLDTNQENNNNKIKKWFSEDCNHCHGKRQPFINTDTDSIKQSTQSHQSQKQSLNKQQQRSPLAGFSPAPNFTLCIFYSTKPIKLEMFYWQQGLRLTLFILWSNQTTVKLIKLNENFFISLKILKFLILIQNKWTSLSFT